METDENEKVILYTIDMKQHIRQQVFETNSSSTHSISIAENSAEFELIMDNTLIPDNHGYIRLNGGEFGWEWRRYNDALTKANYISVLLLVMKNCIIRWKEMDCEMVKSYSNDPQYIQLLKWCDENYGNCYLIFKNVIMEQTACKYIQIVAQSGYNGENYSYIDHQSCEAIRQFQWLMDGEAVRQFIFNRNSWLFTGNDNSMASCTFKDVPVYTKEEVIEPIYQYEVGLDGYSKTEKFKQKPDDEQIACAVEFLCQGLYVREDGSFDDDDSVEAQMSRNEEKAYRHSYEKETDFHTNTVFFVKDIGQIVRQKWEEGLAEKKWGKENRWEKEQELKKKLYDFPDSPFVKKVTFTVKEIAA